MTHVRTALIVSRNSSQQVQVDAWLRASGYETTIVADFDVARRLLTHEPPDLLVADVKLGAYNGLHLAIWTQGRSLPTRAILIGDLDPVLQLEATRARAAYLALPVDETSFVGVLATLFSYTPARRSPRKRVSIDAMVDGMLASVIDLSYEGLRLALPDAAGLSVPPFLTITIPAFDISCRVKCVWQDRPIQTRGTLWCGATLPDNPGPSSAAWRMLVDSVTGFDGVRSADTATSARI
jgi:CheY-like chemotaxis protein